MEFLPHEKSDDVRNDTGVIVDFPADGFRMPPQRLPHEIGHIDKGHPFRWTILAIIISLGLFLVGYILFAGATCSSGGEYANDIPAVTEFRDPGAITYDKVIIQGWFLDQEREHFLSEDGRRFTYVDPHSREGSPVTGYWRLREK